MNAVPTPIAEALGRIPTGLYVVSCRDAGVPLGFVGSFLMQVGFVPPTVCVAVGRSRAHLDAIRRAGRFGVSILDVASAGAMGAFFRPAEAGRTPFDDLEVLDAPGGSPVLASGLAWLECTVRGEHPAGDHTVLFGEVAAGARLRDGDPSVHLRRDGLRY